MDLLFQVQFTYIGHEALNIWEWHSRNSEGHRFIEVREKTAMVFSRPLGMSIATFSPIPSRGSCRIRGL